MTKVNFYLKVPQSSKETGIFAKIKLGRKYYKYHFAKKIKPSFWNFREQRPFTDKKTIPVTVVSERKILELTNLKIILNNLEAQTISFIQKNELAGKEISFDNLKEYLNEVLNLNALKGKKLVNGDAAKKSSDSVSQFYSFIIEQMKNGKQLTPARNKYSEGTAVSYSVSLKRLRRFENEKNKIFSFNEIDLNFYNQYIQFFQDLNFAHNTIGNDIKHLKVIMELAFCDELHDNLTFKDKRFKKFDFVPDKIFLNKEEIEKIKNLNLENHSSLNISRDYFLIAYYTGQRISDVLKFSKENLYNKDFFRFYVKKGGEEMIIPLSTQSKEILSKYDFNLPKSSNQKINSDLKKIGEMAFLSEEILLKENRGGKNKILKKSKFEMITTHTARRSTITNLKLDGVENGKIMAISGHKSELTLNRYIKSSVNDKAELLKKLEFFK